MAGTLPHLNKRLSFSLFGLSFIHLISLPLYAQNDKKHEINGYHDDADISILFGDGEGVVLGTKSESDR